MATAIDPKITFSLSISNAKFARRKNNVANLKLKPNQFGVDKLTEIDVKLHCL